MSKKIGLILLMAILLLLTGCGAISGLTNALHNGPSVCDDTTEASDLCDAAIKHDVSLEGAGNSLIIINAGAIMTGAYTTGDALIVLERLLFVVSTPVTNVFFKNKLEAAFVEYPGLLSVGRIYLQALDSPDIMHPKDRRILTTFLTNRIVEHGGGK